MDDMPSEKDET